MVRRTRTLGAVAVLLVIGGAQVLFAAPASAHASFIAANPRPGVGLPQAPGAVAMRFSEPLNLGLSRITVLDRHGRDVGQGRTLAVERDRRAMRRKLGLLSPGIYTVRWLSVSTVDGHTLRGSYAFGVGAAALPAERLRAGPLDSEGAAGLAARWVALAGLAVWVGFVVLGGVAASGGVSTRRLDVLGRVGPAVTLVGTALMVMSVALHAGASATEVGAVLRGTSGHWRALELVAATAGAATPPRRWAQAPLLAVAVLAEAASGHAAATAWPPLAVASLSLHLLAVGTWIFALVAALLSTSARRLLSSIWPWAVGAAAVVALTGVLNSISELNSFRELVSTGYGRAVLVKIAALVTMATLGLVHSTLRRRATTAEATIRRPVTAELAVAALAIATATALVGFPNPPRQVEASEQEAGAELAFTDLDGTPALSIADGAGPFIVGLTVVPPRPGPVEFRVRVLGVEAGDGLGDATVRAVGPAGPATASRLAECGLGCFRGSGVLQGQGQWAFRVALHSARGPVEASFSAPLPTPDGRAALQRALDGMELLRAVAMEERLRGRVGGPEVASRYRFSAPDGFETEVDQRRSIVIGARSFDREDPSKAWEASVWPGRPFRWPQGYLREFWRDPVAVSVLGTQQLDGASMTVISFLRADLPAWFRIWVGVVDGLVHREEMRAEGHLMDHVYLEFNTSPRIVPPA